MPFARIYLTRLPLPRSPLVLAEAARRWSDSSQTRARRNAMVALTSLAERRAEREDADAYLEAATSRSDVPVPAPRSADGS
ncbi:hypothetical protein [Nocardioides sp. CER19]|uniref:hypothetical protein n=1 Tax=Nocardioides sp. CER19 TaxID=3038538 RepID=UPI00244781B8|nr:hypothetical protein [Nocardioides sp. CER19]MDH2414105.1 hypothetical protein [Nocardioides sp. CER19]